MRKTTVFDVPCRKNLKRDTEELSFNPKETQNSNTEGSSKRKKKGQGWIWRFSSVQFSHSVMSDSLWPHESQHTRPPCPSPTPGVYPNSRPSSQWCHQPSHPLSSPSPPAPNPSQHMVFSNKSTLHMRWPKYWSFTFSISPSNEHPGLISFRMDWLDLLAVQGTLKSLLQHHSSKASILQRSAFFTVQLSLHRGT